MLVFIETTPDYHVFADADGGRHSVGVSVGSADEARALLENPQPAAPQGYNVPDTDIYIRDDRDAETEFNKLLATVELKLRRGTITPESVVPYWDINGAVRFIAAGDVDELLDGYSTHCLNKRLSGG